MMKKIILALACVLALPAFGQYRPNYYTTNSNPGISIPAGSNTVYSMIIAYGINPTNGITAAVATNIAAWQAYIATNGMLPQTNISYTAVTNAPWGLPQTNISYVAVTNAPWGLPQTNISYTAVTNAPWGLPQTNISYTAVTNAPWLTTQTNISYTAVTNAPWGMPQTNISYTSVTNAPWGLPQTNISYTAVTNAPWGLPQTNISYTAVTNAPWISSVTITNSTNAVGLVSGGANSFGIGTNTTGLGGGGSTNYALLASGSATLSGGTNKVSTPYANSAYKFFVSAISASGDASVYYVRDIVADTSFVIQSMDSADTNRVDWQIIDPAGIGGRIADSLIALTPSGTNALIDFSLASRRTLSLTTNCLFSVTNTTAGQSVFLLVTCDATTRSLYFDTNLIAIGAPVPGSITANKRAELEFYSWGTNAANVTVKYAEQP
jgi:hypothetical protein